MGFGGAEASVIFQANQFSLSAFARACPRGVTLRILAFHIGLSRHCPHLFFNTSRIHSEV